MKCYNEKIKLDPFKIYTTYQNDYKRYCDLKDYGTKKLYTDITIKPSGSQRHIDQETFRELNTGCKIPFNLFFRPKPILHKYPNYSDQKLEQDSKQIAEEVIKTRPRLYVPPGVSIDDIEDQEAREKVCKYMYTTDWRAAEQEACLPSTIRNAALLKEPSVPVKLETELIEPLPPKWQKLGKAWDEYQDRAQVDPTTMFWKHKDPPVKCGACINPLKNIVSEETKETISQLIKEDRLRPEHDIRCASYAGYIPQFTDSVPLAETEIPISHPLLSVSRIAKIRYNDPTGHTITYDE